MLKRCQLLPVKPFRGIAHRLLVELEAQSQVRAMCSVTGKTEVIIFVTGPVVTGTQPDVGRRAEADGYTVRVIILIAVPAVQRTGARTSIPALAQVLAILDTERVGIAGIHGTIDGVTRVLGAIIRTGLRALAAVVDHQVVDQFPVVEVADAAGFGIDGEVGAVEEGPAACERAVHQAKS